MPASTWSIAELSETLPIVEEVCWCTSLAVRLCRACSSGVVLSEECGSTGVAAVTVTLVGVVGDCSATVDEVEEEEEEGLLVGMVRSEGAERGAAMVLL